MVVKNVSSDAQEMKIFYRKQFSLRNIQQWIFPKLQYVIQYVRYSYTCSIPYAYFGPYLGVWASPVPVYLYELPIHVRDRVMKLNLLNCSWIKEHLYQHKLARVLSPCNIWTVMLFMWTCTMVDIALPWSKLKIINREAMQEEAYCIHTFILIHYIVIQQ